MLTALLEMRPQQAVSRTWTLATQGQFSCMQFVRLRGLTSEYYRQRPQFGRENSLERVMKQSFSLKTSHATDWIDVDASDRSGSAWQTKTCRKLGTCKD
jgi:hypothetical protein